MRHLFTTALLFLAISAGAKDVKTVVYTTQPQMHCANCEKKIKENVRFVKGVRQIKTDVKQQRVTIQYDADKTSPQKIADAFRKIGYDTKEVKETKK